MFWVGLVKFWLLPGHHGPSLESRPMLPNFKVWLSLWIVLKLSLIISHTDKVKMAGGLFVENEWSSTQNLKSLLNLNLALNSKAIQSYLNFSKDIDALLDTKSVGECSSNSCVQENREDLLYDPETDEIIRNLDLKSVIHPSPSQGSSIDRLFSQELDNSNSPLELSDVFNLLSSHKDSIVYDSNQKFDFTAGVLNPTFLREFGLNQENVNLVSEGLKVNLKKELDYSKLKAKPNNLIWLRIGP